MIWFNPKSIKNTNILSCKFFIGLSSKDFNMHPISCILYLFITSAKNTNHNYKPMHIAVAGNIGAGKTTLTRLLSKHYQWEAQFEDVVDNPYLDDFYNQMERWSFNLQIYFLNNRYRQILQIRKGGKDTIQDRTIYEDAHIFAPNLHAMGLMTNRDFSNYTSLFELMETLVQPPDLLIYLRSSIPNLVNQIHKRGREYENSISIDYLSRLNERYEAWAQSYEKGNLLVIDVDKLNFVDEPEDLGLVINKIDAEINGLF
ncbi:deoxyadenosine/deoxycytidine kinase [Arenibacter algicola]|uniref:Deoxyadenosine/deoxycytidine kinase n=2 Tax=Flavobacteriaceae TaxID=49546 RepID=A0A221UR78_9FLAO|nr:deoxyadenosine/deoxycytidine kinase [Arenibacter algicola]GBF20490.1 deoxyadenosine/deoxycytidine kinase [Arenibacter sp. NBRC 103722]